MKRIIKIVITSFFLLLVKVSFSQDAYIDSLKRVTSTTTNESVKTSAQISLAKYYWFNTRDVDSATRVMEVSLGVKNGKGDPEQVAGKMYWRAYFLSAQDNPDAYRRLDEGLQFALREKLPAYQSAFLLLYSMYTKHKDSVLLCASQALTVAQKSHLAAEQAKALLWLAGIKDTMQADSLRILLLKALALIQNAPAEIRVDVLRGIASLWGDRGRTDTALFYMRQAISVAKENNLVSQELFLLSRLIMSRGPFFIKDSLDYYYDRIITICETRHLLPVEYMFSYLRAAQDIGKYPQALKAGLKALAICRETGNKNTEQAILDGIARLYTLSGDYHKAIIYLHQGVAITKERDQWGGFYTRLATCYSKLNIDDSAKYYADLSYKTAARYFGAEANVPPGTLDDLAGIYLQLGQDSLALDFLRRCYVFFSQGVDYNNYAETTTFLARYFAKHGPADSLLYYALKSFRVSLKNNYPDYLTETSYMIANYYLKKGNTDSAYYYLSVAYDTYKQLYNQENIRSFQNLSFLEQQRQEDIAREKELANERYQSNLKMIGLGAALIMVSIIGFITYRNNRQKQKANTVLENTLSDLKSTQSQLIQAEKMASLGELTAGIAHEIQNPLNFVNNFSEVNKDLLVEMKEELDKGNYDEVKQIADDVISNEEKINHHGKRADAIVKGMLQHSRSSSGVKEPTDINALCDEYLRLAYHGLRAKDKSFNAKFDTHFDAGIGKINVMPQEMGRVVLNLINNAFYAVNEKAKSSLHNTDGYEPAVTVSTKKDNGKVMITVSDNGTGIPQKVVDKIFQPFFTTKPTGEGTGLGLSLSYDIITKAHAGELKVETKEGEGTSFVIVLPV